MWEFVDKVVYINLDKRKDRDERTREVLACFGSKVIRMAAVETSPGFIGCLQSHIAVLRAAIAHRWENVLVVEDDIEWNDFDAGYDRVKKLAAKRYDVIHFGPTTERIGPEVNKLISGQTTTAYLINRDYIPTLLQCYESALPLLIATHDESKYGADQCWKPLMLTGAWYAPIPVLTYQRPDFSDIRQRYQDHRETYRMKA
jgi:glycosyl transferase family 25